MGRKKSMTQCNKYAGMEGVSLSLSAKRSGEYKIFNMMRHKIHPSKQGEFDDLVDKILSFDEELKLS